VIEVSQAPSVRQSAAVRAGTGPTYAVGIRHEKPSTVDEVSDTPPEEGRSQPPVSPTESEPSVEGDVGEPTPEGSPTTTPTWSLDAGDQLIVCHKPDGKNPKTMTLAADAVKNHLAHGDAIGACPDQTSALGP
jgi:hypothetical protein